MMRYHWKIIKVQKLQSTQVSNKRLSQDLSINTKLEGNKFNMNNTIKLMQKWLWTVLQIYDVTSWRPTIKTKGNIDAVEHNTYIIQAYNIE